MVDYLARSDAPLTSHYHSTLTVAKTNMINQLPNPPRAIDKVKKHRREERFPTDTCQNRTAEGVKTCDYVSAYGNIQFDEYANISSKQSKPAESVMSYERNSANRKRDTCILRNLCTRRKRKTRFRPHGLQANCSLFSQYNNQNLSSNNMAREFTTSTPD